MIVRRQRAVWKLVLCAAVTAAWWGVAPQSGRANFVIPRSLATTEGASLTQPTGLFGSAAITAQIQVAEAELLAQGLAPGDLIVGARHRLDVSQNSALPLITTTIPNLELTLAEAAGTISGMSTAYADNMVDPVLVRSGNYTLTVGVMPASGNPKPFAPTVMFDTPYEYQGGDLVFYYTHQAIQGQTMTLDHAGPVFAGAGTLYRTLQNGGYQNSTGFLGPSTEIIEFVVTVVPEARAWLMLGVVGGATLCVGAWRRRTS